MWRPKRSGVPMGHLGSFSGWQRRICDSCWEPGRLGPLEHLEPEFSTVKNQAATRVLPELNMITCGILFPGHEDGDIATVYNPTCIFDGRPRHGVSRELHSLCRLPKESDTQLPVIQVPARWCC